MELEIKLQRSTISLKYHIDTSNSLPAWRLLKRLVMCPDKVCFSLSLSLKKKIPKYTCDFHQGKKWDCLVDAFWPSPPSLSFPKHILYLKNSYHFKI